MLGKTSVKTQLGTGFGVLIVAMIAMAGVGLVGMHSVNAHLERIVQVESAKVEQANNLNNAMRGNARRMMEMLVTTDAAAMQQIRDRIEANRKLGNEALEKLEQLVVRPEAKTLLARIKDERGAFVASLTRVLKLVDEGKRADAVALALGEAKPLLDKALAASGELLELQKRAMAEAETAARAGFARARLLMIAIALGALALAIGIAWWITRSILRQLGGEPGYVAEVVSRVAGGDLAVEIRTRAGDETSLLAAMRRMV
ncbi:MAG: MCP four helix bundle domain-containing protein, partial [Burkholderiales bacterium]|nr:MCP four helix bundle domain-containing protein [Burkholderiales bacterium]